MVAKLHNDPWSGLFRFAFGLGRIAILVVVVLSIAFVVALLVASFSTPSWYYSINARSEIVELSLPSEIKTTWPMEGATLCSKVTLDGLQAVVPAASPCGRSWKGYTVPSDLELKLVLGGGAPSPGQTIEIKMEAGTDSQRGLQVHISGDQHAQSLGKVVSIGQGDETTLGNQINLIWSGGERPRDLVFPFIADRVTVGLTAASGNSALLLEGKMEILAASGETLSKRTRIEEADLLPGDQVSLGSSDGKTPLRPKGFLRFDRLQANDSPNTLRAVAFGTAESVRIERSGESGYDFQPSWWGRISHDGWVVTIAGLLAGFVGLLGVHSAIRDIHHDWLKSGQKTP